MALAWTDLKAYVNAPTADDTFVQQCWNEAIALVTKFVGTATVPDTIKDRARIEAGQELYSRRAAPNGIAQYATFEGASAIRVARDPMVGAYPLLQPYVGQGIA
jgi:hypothetical protein